MLASGPQLLRNYFAAARMFIRSRAEKRLITLPLNLTSRNLAFTQQRSDNVLFTPEEIEAFLDAANERQQLYILLCLNLGAYGSDIGTLKKSEVDLVGGRIKRQRTKTRGRSKNVPCVDYPLWKRTRRLLEKLIDTSDGEFALLTEDGLPLWREVENSEGKFCRLNAVKSALFHLQHDVMKLAKKDRKPLKSLRKTGATMLENSVYGRFSEHYLGEAPKTIASRHYAHKNGSEFDEAILWLGKRLGIE